MAAPLPPNTSQREVTFALSLIKYVHGNTKNLYLLLAVIAWVRAEGGWTGNNPLNIRNSPMATGRRLIKGNGYFSTFTSLDLAAKASAAFLMSVHGVGYEMILAAMRRMVVDPASQQAQAVDFLLSLALSKWDAGHYGMTGAKALDPNNIYKTSLYRIYAGLTGHRIIIPADKPKAPPKVHVKPQAPREYYHPIYHVGYIMPYDSYNFLETRIRPQDAGAPVDERGNTP